MSIAVAGLFLWFRREIFLDHLFTISGLWGFFGGGCGGVGCGRGEGGRPRMKIISSEARRFVKDVYGGVSFAILSVLCQLDPRRLQVRTDKSER